MEDASSDDAVMSEPADLLLFGSGAFAARIAFDIAATATAPVSVVIAGRNAVRRDWLRVAANARAANFGRPAVFRAHAVDLLIPDAAAEAITACRPKVVVQAATTQTSAVISGHKDAWGQLVAEGGLGITAVFNALFSSRVARAVKKAGSKAYFVNCGFPDVVNSILAALELPITCGFGNVAILATAFAGEQGIRVPGRLKVLAHYETIGAWRRPAAERAGMPAARVWIDDAEVGDIYAAFRGVKLTPEPVIDISGATGVPLILAMIAGSPWQGHVPGPNGLPGGYPVAFCDGGLDLDLPTPIGRAEAIAWNARFEAEDGLAVDATGRARYSGRLYEKLRAVSPTLADGFSVRDIEPVHREMEALRAQLQARPAS
jgi:hypothetical protein